MRIPVNVIRLPPAGTANLATSKIMAAQNIAFPITAGELLGAHLRALETWLIAFDSFAKPLF
jgi:hypothetical protein